MRTPEEQQAWERQAYGCLAEDFLRSVENDSISVRCARQFPNSPMADPSRGYGMVVMSLLSDTQELMDAAVRDPRMAHRHLENARQHVNRAKLLMSREWMGHGRDDVSG